MTAWVALLRAVNVGGTGKLAMADLQRIGEAAGGRAAKTYIASGNLVFASDKDEAAIRGELERRLEEHAGRPIGVLVRSAADMAAVRDANPFADEPGNRVTATFLPGEADVAMIGEVRHCAGERIALGPRVLYVAYGDGMRESKLVIPAARTGTARNMNTVAKLAAMAAALD